MALALIIMISMDIMISWELVESYNFFSVLKQTLKL